MTDAKPSFKLVAELDAPGSGAWQGHGYNRKTGEYFLGHSLGSGANVFYRFGKATGVKKPFRDKMTFLDGTHIYGFGIADDYTIWTSWDQRDGNDIVTVKYKPGAKIRKAQSKKMHVFSERPTQMSFSPTRAGIVLLKELAPNKFELTKHMTANIVANKNEPVGKPINVTVPRGTWLQGFSLCGDHIYVCYGKTDLKAWIDKYDIKTGKKIGTLDITSAGLLPGESSKGASREPEGMDGQTFSVKVFHDDKRKLRVFKLIDF